MFKNTVKNYTLFDDIFQEANEIFYKFVDLNSLRKFEEKNNKLYCEYVVPGVKKDKIKFSFDSTTGKQKINLDVDGKKYFTPINLDVDTKNICAKLEDGILYITLPLSDNKKEVNTEIQIQ